MTKFLNKVLRSVVTAAFAALCGGCHLFQPLPSIVQDMGPRYHPNNVYRADIELPREIRRVAVLPLVTPATTSFLQSGAENLEPLVYAELEKSKRFEVITLTPDQLRQLTGKAGWKADDILPTDFFSRIADATGCDAVMFCQLTRCFPYQPIAVGWKFSLVENLPAKTLTPLEVKDKVLWSADEVIDAGEPGVANAARDYYYKHLLNETPAADATTILNSPTRFGQYTLAALLDTMPLRWAPPKTKVKVEVR